MKFSVITPTFNRAKTLIEAVASVLPQTHQDWELIIKDGCLDSAAIRDEEFRKIMGSDARIVYLLEKDSGITQGLNQAARVATGDIMVEMNDDDMLFDNTVLERVHHIFENDARMQWMYSKMQFINEQGVGGGESGRPTSIGELIHANTICQPTVFWRKSFFDAHGGFDESFPYAQDYDLWVRFWKSSEPVFYDGLTAKYRLHPGSITSSMGMRQAADAQKVKEKHQ